MKIRLILSLFITALTAILLFQIIGKNYHYFDQTCTIKDVLTWDENLRLITVLDQYQDLKHGNLYKAIFPVLDSPTWPYLHSWITSYSFF